MNRVATLAFLVLLIGTFLLLGAIGVYIHDLRQAAEAAEDMEPLEIHLHLVVSDITMDVNSRHVFASDFVRIIHTEDTVEPYVVGANANFELYLIGRDDQYWTREWHFECEDLGVTEIWVRLQDDGFGSKSTMPVRAYLTLVDTWGTCGEPLFYEGPTRHEEEE